MSLIKTGTAWVFLPRPCLYFTSSHKTYNYYLIPFTISPLQEKNDLCSVLWKKSYFQTFLNVHPLKLQGFHLSKVPKSHSVIRTGHILLYFCVQLFLLTVLEHPLTQPVPFWDTSFTACLPQDTKAFSIQMPDSPWLSDTQRLQSSPLHQISATSEKEYSALSQPNTHVFEQPGLGSLLSSRLTSSVFVSCLPTASLFSQWVLPTIFSGGQAPAAHCRSCADQPGSKMYWVSTASIKRKLSCPLLAEAFIFSCHPYPPLVFTIYPAFKTSKPWILAKFSWINQQILKLLKSNAEINIWTEILTSTESNLILSKEFRLR